MPRLERESKIFFYGRGWPGAILGGWMDSRRTPWYIVLDQVQAGSAKVEGHC